MYKRQELLLEEKRVAASSGPLLAAAALEERCALLASQEGRESFGSAVRLIAAVLRGWAARWGGGGRRGGGGRWRSLLEKRSLLHEAEEAVVPLATLLQWLEARGGCGVQPLFTLVDLCCGKGVFSLIVSHAAALEPRLRAIGYILMIDRATRSQVDWGMVDDANADVAGLSEPDPTSTAAVPLELWPDCNIHEKNDIVEDRLRSSPGQVLIVGIHLCRSLSPRAISLYNRLGRDKACLLYTSPSPRD